MVLASHTIAADLTSATSIIIQPARDASGVKPLELVCSLLVIPQQSLIGVDASGPTKKIVNAGDNDASPDNTPSQFLLLRGLEPSVTEELLSKGVAKLFKPAGSATQHKPSQGQKGAKVASTTGDSNLGAKDGTLRSILLVRDRESKESWRFGFAEFASVEDAQAALTRYNSFDKFTIASKPVLVSYIHAGVFVPVVNPSASTERFTFNPTSNSALRLKYWDDEAYVTQLVVTPPVTTVDEMTPADLATPAPAQVEVVKPTKTTEKFKKRKSETPAITSSSNKKATPSHLQFWSNRHAELHGLESKGFEAGSGREGTDSPEQGTDAPPSQSYADPKRNCCYLCSRQFKTMAEVNRHERLSDLHRQNLQDEELVARAKAKLEKHGVPVQLPTIEYRDRAKERRKAYGVVNKKGQQVFPAAHVSKIDSDDDKPVPTQSKGASLLSKMGYTAGSGLGLSGSGMTVPISQDVYVAGVGLGAQGGKVGDAVAEAERNTRGDYAGFAERTREGARERYQQL